MVSFLKGTEWFIFVSWMDFQSIFEKTVYVSQNTDCLRVTKFRLDVYLWLQTDIFHTNSVNLCQNAPH